MSGHSKWSKVKHQKEATDAAKGKVFTKMSKAIMVAIKEGGAVTDPSSNFRLRLAIEKARNFNMPKENIERAIEKAKGGEGQESLVEAVYEAFGPQGIGMIIVAVTDNKQRTVAELKNTLERGGGVLATSGAVSHFFKHAGLIKVSKSGKTFDSIFEAAINTGAIDLEEGENEVSVYTQASDLHKVKEGLSALGFTIEDAELFYRPVTAMPISDVKVIGAVTRLIANLEDLDDVQRVFANFSQNLSS